MVRGAMGSRHRTTILLDLDGTLIDPAVGILRCYRLTLEALGCPVAPEDDLRWVIGPPPKASFARLLGGRGDPDAAVRLYRARYSETGIFEATVYPGVIEALALLREQRRALILCTSKARPFADRIVIAWILGAPVGAFSLKLSSGRPLTIPVTSASDPVVTAPGPM